MAEQQYRPDCAAAPSLVAEGLAAISAERVLVCEECGCRVRVFVGRYATHGIRHPEDSPTCEASGTEPD